MPTLTVTGKVVTTDGEPLDNKVVTLKPRLSASTYATSISTLTTAGAYTVTYSTTGTETGFDVELVVSDAGAVEIGRSVLLYGVSGEITVDIVIGSGAYRGRSEYRRIDARIGSLRGTLAVKDLGRDHVEYLAAKLDVDPLRVAQYLRAHKLQDFLDDDVQAEIFYALLRQGLPSDLAQLVAQGRALHQRAITESIANNIITDPGTAAIEDSLDRLEGFTIESAVWSDPASPVTASKFSRLIGTATGSEAALAKQIAFMAKHLTHTGTVAAFWSAVEGDGNLGPAVRKTYEWTIQISALTNDHMPLIEALQARRADPGDPIKTFRDLASLDVDDWVELVKDSSIGAPPSIPTDWAAEDRILRYAETLERIVADTYPTAVIHKRIARDHNDDPGSVAGAADLIQFFADNPEFELDPHELDAYLADHPGALANVTDAAATRANLKKLQRLGRLAPRGLKYAVIKPLYQAGLHSAVQIGRMSRSSFVRKYGAALGGNDVAAAVHQKASQSSGVALTLATRFSRAFNQTPIGVIPSSQLPDFEGHPELEELFGNLDFCACEHCRSVYSPTAYFADLLQYLRNQPGEAAGSDALDALKKRRPELTTIELSCVNTNTEVPYIDLVNELLEYHVSRHAPTPPTVGSSHWQTTWTADELALRPEHQIEAAYAVTAQTPYPWILPFDLPFAESSLYHQSFDVSRERMEDAYPNDDPDYADRRARARLGLDLVNWYIVIESGIVGWAPGDYWNETGESWWLPLRTVSTLLKRAELDIDELATLLRTRFIARAGLGITYAAPPDDCNLDLATVPALNEEDLKKLHRFIRLQRRLGWTADDLDAALWALGGASPALNAGMVRKLAAAHRLAERLKLPLDVLLTFWSPLPTLAPPSDPSRPSFYASRFIIRALEGSAATNFALADPPTELANVAGRLAGDARVSTVQSALGISGEQVALLDEWLDSDETNLSVLSMAHRRTALARALGVPLSELRRLIDVVGVSPFREDGTAPTESDLANTEAFLDAVSAIRSSAFTSEQIAYLLRHTTPRTPGVAPRPEDRATALTELNDGLTALRNKYAFTAGSLGEGPLAAQLRDALAEILTADELDAAMTLIDGTSAELETGQEARIDAHFDLDGPNRLVIFADPADARAKLVTGGGSLGAPLARYEYVLSRLYAAMRARSSRELVVQRLAQHFGLAVDSTLALLSEYLTTPSPLLDFFADEALLTGGAPNEAAIYAYERVHKSARVISGFALDAAQLAYLYEGGVSGWLDLDDLPSGEAPVTPLAFSGWKRLYDFTRARSLFPYHPSTLADLRAASGAEIVGIIAERLGWEVVDVGFAIDFVHHFDDADFDDEAALLVVAETVMVARQLLTPVRRVKYWADQEPTADQAREMRRALRGRYDESTWRQAARSIQDALRIQQCDALVACLIARGIAGTTPTPIASADALYAHLLVDVEMSVCMLTSRIRFALNSVQQFIQRTFLGLEGALTFDEDAAAEWQWMKHYRVWEANRKVFLYPENWVEPGLRDDKSPFFRELEETLLQGDVTKSLAETAYVTYLERLQEVALPEVMGMYHEYEKAGKEVRANDVHVVARTGHGPFRHFYRKLHDLSRWTAWEPLPGDVKGEHILPFVYGGRLYVFWVEFQIESVQPKDGPVDAENPKTPTKRLVARLFWIENRDGVWTSRFHADGCVAWLGSPISAAVEQDRIRFTCGASEDKETHGLDITIYEALYVDYKQAVDLQRRGSFKMLPKKGNFSWKAESGTVESLLGFSVTRNAQRWDSVEENFDAWYINRTTDGEILGFASLFEPSHRALSTLFAHDNVSSVLRPSGFFVTGERHRFYVVPRVQGELDKTSKALRHGRSGLHEPWVNEQEYFPWRAYAFLDAGAAPSTSGYQPDRSQELIAADALQVPLMWRGGVPGVEKNVLAEDITAGTRSAKLAMYQSGVSDILGQVPSPHMNVVPGPYSDDVFKVSLFQHTYVGSFLGFIRRFGVEGLLRPPPSEQLSRQKIAEIAVPSPGNFDPEEHDYEPGEHLKISFLGIRDGIDFTYEGPYSLYNWEIFFHAPLLIAGFLTRQGRYEEADSWLRGIFDPTATDGPSPERFWRIKPFHDAEPIESINALLQLLQGNAEDVAARNELEKQIKEWRDNPFNPHLLARMREGTYQRATVMQYLDNLIAWGDARFREDTIESINEATQIYALARSILGDRPAEVKKTVAPAARTFDELEASLDSFSNALVELETKSQGPTDPDAPDVYVLNLDWINADPTPKFWYFCVPSNPELLAYWDVVEDRLFKIRHCQDIHGVERRLALFDPPIDPGQLVKALSGGSALSTALTQLASRAPVYRFQTYLSKAYELASEVRALGSGLLQAYEKRDAEDLSLLRSQHERSVLALSRAVKVAQVEEADQGLRAAEATRPITQARRDYYQGLVDAGWLVSEQAQVDMQQAAMDATLAAGLASLLGSELGLFPNFDFGVEGMSSPVVKASFGGQQLAAVAGMFAGILQTESAYSSMASGLAGINAGYERRLQDWQQQVAAADLELQQIDQQIEAGRARKVVAEKELQSHDLQIENAEVADAFMRSKYTNTELYGWMIAKVSSLYKQAYELAYRAAVAAEKAYQYELHSDESFIGFGYWDQSRSGLLAGEILALDLRRLDAAYLDNNRREYELTKRVSLAQLDPYALVQLRETGSCYVNVPEHVFDLDHPGHYLRRIKMVSVALPGVTGPHVNVGCTLTLESSKLRVSPSLAPEYPEQAEDLRFTYRVGKVEQIATSSGQDSTGMFESSLNDPRYLPFEGAGAISVWKVSLPVDQRQFDYRTIADVVITIQYTAREGGGALRDAALEKAREAANLHPNVIGEQGSALLLRASTDFSAAWHTFLFRETASSIRELDLELSASRFPYLAARWPNLKIKSVRLILVTDLPESVDGVVLERDGVNIGTVSLMSSAGVLNELPTGSWTDLTENPGPWKVKVDAGAVGFPAAYREAYQIDDTTYYRLKQGAVRDMLVLVRYELA